MFKVLIAALLIVGSVYAGDVAFEICASKELAVIHRFAVSGCDDGATKCEFVIGQTYTFELEATTSPDAPEVLSIPYKVTGSLLGIPITLAEGEACEQIACPVPPGTRIIFSLEKEIPTTVPALNNIKVSARVWANAVTTNPEAAACASITVSIVKA